MPSFDSRSETSGDLAKAAISSRNASTIGSGVPAGAKKPFQDENSKPGMVSATVGMSGAAGMRCGGADGDQADLVAVDVRQQRRGIAEVEIDLSGHRSAIAGGSLLAGTITRSMPARANSSTGARWLMFCVPATVKLSLPGLALA